MIAHEIARGLFAYEWLRRLWKRRHPDDARWSASFAPVYVYLLWLPVLLVLFATHVTAPGNGPLRALLGLAAWRLADIANFYVGLFFDRRQNLLAGFERSLLCLVGNFVETVVATAVLLEAAAGDSRTDAWVHALSILTFVALPFNADPWPVVVESVAAFIALLLTAGGLSMLVGAIGGKFRVGAHEGRRTRSRP